MGPSGIGLQRKPKFNVNLKRIHLASPTELFEIRQVIGVLLEPLEPIGC